MPSRTHKTVLRLVAAKTNYGTAACTFSWSTVPLSCCCNNYCEHDKQKPQKINKQHLFQPRSISAMFFATMIMIARYFAHVNMPAVCLHKVNGSHVSRWGNCLLKENLCVRIMCQAVKETAVAAKEREMFIISLSRLGKDYLVQVTSCWLWLPNGCSNYCCI